MSSGIHAAPPKHFPSEQTDKQIEQAKKNWEQDFKEFKEHMESILVKNIVIMQNRRAQEEDRLHMELFNQQQGMLKRNPSVKEFIYYAETYRRIDYFCNSLDLLVLNLDLLKTQAQNLEIDKLLELPLEVRESSKKEFYAYLGAYIQCNLNSDFFDGIVKINQIAVRMKNRALLYQYEDTMFKDMAQLMETLSTNLCVCYGIAYRVVHGSVSSDLYSQIDKLLNTISKIGENIKTFQSILPKLL